MPHASSLTQNCAYSNRGKVILLRLPDLRTELDWSGLWFSELGADAVYELLLEVTLTTARRRLPELCIHRNDLALLFQSPEERVR